MFNVGSVQGYLKLNTVGWNTPMRRAATSLTSLTRSFVKLGAVAVGSLFLIEREFGKFDKAIRHATSVSETTQEQFKKMSDMALDASVQWNKAATNTAQAFYFLGSAGLTVNEQLAAFNDTIMLSRAMGSELGQTVEGVVDIVRAFGLEFQNITSIADQLTKTVISSNQQFRTLSQALSYGASTARLANNTLAETTAMLGVMANAGIKGSMAGTVLRRAITNLMSPTGAMAGLIYELGVNIYDSTGKMNPFINIMGQISDQLKGTSDEYKNMVFEVLFGRRAIAGQIVLFNYGSEALQEYANSIRDAGGTTERVAGKQMKAFTEQLGRLWREIQRLAIVAGDTLAPAIERVSEALRTRVEAFRGFVEANREAVASSLRWTAALSVMLLIGGPLLLLVASLATKMVALAAVITNPFIALVASLYVLRAVWKQTSRELIQEARETMEALAYKQVGGAGIALGSAALGASFGLMVGGAPGAGVGGAVGLGLGIFEARRAKQVFQNYVETGREASIDFSKVWKEAFEATKKQMQVDFSAGAGFIDTTLENTGGLVGKLAGNFKEYIASIKALFGAFMAEPDVRHRKMVERLNNLNTELREFIRASNEAASAGANFSKQTGYLADEWGNAVRAVFEPLGRGPTWSKSFVTALDDVQSAWSSAIVNLTQEGSNFGDFMDNMFQGVLDAFFRMLSEIMAADLLHAIVGDKVERPFNTATTMGFIKGLLGLDTGTARGGLQVQPSTAGQWQMPSTSGGFAAQVGKIAINVENKGAPVNLRETGRSYNGKQLIINAVMEAYDTDPSVRDALNR